VAGSEARAMGLKTSRRFGTTPRARKKEKELAQTSAVLELLNAI
jgi:hypothetical protein